jgi:hypothetical protein
MIQATRIIFFRDIPTSLQRIPNNLQIGHGLLFPMLYFLTIHDHLIIQDTPGEKANILGGHSICLSKQESIYVHVSYSERFPR